MTKEEKELVMKLAEEGKTATDICNITGICTGTVSSYVSREKRKIVCPHCGRRFIPKRSNQLFCSAKCRIDYWNSHPELVNKKAYYTLTCKHCGKSFVAYGDKNRKYCSYECYWAERYGKITK